MHLVSKLHSRPDDQSYRAGMLKAEIQRSEAELGHMNTFICGDFNFNPYEDAMVSANSLNAVSSLQVARRLKRTHANVE